MKLVTLQPVEGAQKKVDIKVGKTIIGRGPLLECADKKVSRNHALLEVQDNGDVFLTPTHVNPCFFLPNDSKGGFEVLKKDCPQRIRDGDSFSLLPNSFRYRVIISDVADYESCCTSQSVGDSKDVDGRKDSVSSNRSPNKDSNLTLSSGASAPLAHSPGVEIPATCTALLNGDKRDRLVLEREKSAEKSYHHVQSQQCGSSLTSGTPVSGDSGRASSSNDIPYKSSPLLVSSCSPQSVLASSQSGTPQLPVRDNGKPQAPLKNGLASKKILTEKASLGRRDGSNRDNKDASGGTNTSLAAGTILSDPERQNKLKSFDFEDDDEQSLPPGVCSPTSSVLSPAKPTKRQNLHQSQQPPKLKKPFERSLCGPAASPTASATGTSVIPAVTPSTPPSVFAKRASAGSSLGKDTIVTGSAISKRRSTSPTSLIASFGVPPPSATQSGGSSATTSGVRSTRTNRTLIQRISLDDFMASDDEWIATYTSSDDERKRSRRRHHRAKRKSDAIASESESDEWAGNVSGSRKSGRKRSVLQKSDKKASVNCTDEPVEGNEDIPAEGSCAASFPPKRGRGRPPGVPNRKSFGKRQLPRRGVNSDVESGSAYASNEVIADSNKAECEGQSRSKNVGAIKHGRVGRPTSSLSLHQKKKVFRRKKSYLYAESEEDFQRQLARAIRESRKEQLQREREQREKMIGGSSMDNELLSPT